ncbi:MAG: hypothetical protein LC113_13180 [Acidobacteria bacterium]|nr:hypothetical protein [Acidobacteriota bacterium]
MKRRGAVSGNHVDLETGEEYWVSGIKKDGADRHWAGSGKVAIEESAVSEYLASTGRSELDLSRLEVIRDLLETDIRRFVDLENKSASSFGKESEPEAIATGRKGQNRER